MNNCRRGHAAVVCNGGVYTMGGRNGPSRLDCMERIDANDLLQSSLATSTSTYASPWTMLNCRLSTGKYGCCAVAVHNRYIVVMGGCNRDNRSVDIIDTINHTFIPGPSLAVPRSWCASAVIGHRIFVVGGSTTNTSVEYWDFTKPCHNEERNDDSLSTVISCRSTWITHSDLVLSNPRDCCAVVAVGSSLVVAGGRRNSTVEVLDTHRNRVWNLPPFRNLTCCCSLVTVVNQVAVIGGSGNSTCATFPLMDKNSWCFRRLCEQQPNGLYHFREKMGL